MWLVDVTLVRSWLAALDGDSYELVCAAIELLQERGPHLGRPLVDTIVGSAFSNMKELRPGSAGRTELRVLFAFDPNRQAILLVAGDKSDDWKRWYRRNIPLADERLRQHIINIQQERKE